jgi:hypothetical protein
VKLEKHIITSESIVSLTNEPLEMPAVALKDPGHVDFMLNNLRKYVAKVK